MGTIGDGIYRGNIAGSELQFHTDSGIHGHEKRNAESHDKLGPMDAVKAEGEETVSLIDEIQYQTDHQRNIEGPFNNLFIAYYLNDDGVHLLSPMIFGSGLPI